MFSSTLMIPIRDATETLQRLILAAWPATPAEDDISRVNKLCQQLRAAKSHVIGDGIRAEIDPDFSLDDALEQLKTAARTLRRETVNMVVCLENGKRRAVLLANEVRAELIYPEVVALILGETTMPWRWEYH